MRAEAGHEVWERWSESHPYYAVLTDKRYQKQRIGLHRAEFFSTGEKHVEWLVQAAGLSEAECRQMSVLDHGCGVGRLSVPFARRFANVVAMDVAPLMLEETTRNCAAFEIDNVRTLLCRTPQELPTNTFSLVHSLYVLQHLPLLVGLETIERLAKSLTINGLLALHLTTNRNFRPIVEILHRVRTCIHANNPFTKLRNGAMLGTQYDLARVVSLLAQCSCENFQILTADYGPISSVILCCRRGKYPSGWNCPTFHSH